MPDITRDRISTNPNPVTEAREQLASQELGKLTSYLQSNFPGLLINRTAVEAAIVLINDLKNPGAV